ncbi:MAG: hypothetical protein M1813_004434, partial [Trichoglossum hirsutum]
MPSLSSSFRGLIRNGPQSENPGSESPRESSLRSALRFRKSAKRVGGEPKNSREVGSTGSSTPAGSKSDTATSSETGNIWVRAEQMLSKDERKREVFQAYLGILESQLGSKLQPSGTADRQKQLCQLLDDKTQELEDEKWKVQFGDHKVEVADKLTGALKNVLIAKDLINSASIASPPAAIACAGITVLLTVSLAHINTSLFRFGRACRLGVHLRMLTRIQVVVQAAEQHGTLLKGLESTSELIYRLPVMEDLYRSRANLPSLDPKHSTPFQQKFEKHLTALYSKILEFQARALCYLWKHRVTRFFNDMFKQDGWDELLRDIQESENSTRSFTDLIDREEMISRLEELRNMQKKGQIWTELSARDEKAKKFLQVLYTCPYRERKERNGERIPGTCEWFTNHSRFHNWNGERKSSLLWVSADPGCGKSVLVKHLVDHILPSTDKRTTCYFFFKDDFTDQKSATNAVCAILRQLFLARPHLLRDSILDRFDADGDKFIQSFHDLWNTFTSVAADRNAGELVCILDALDECQDSDRSQLIRAVRNLYVAGSNKFCLKFLLTSRPYDHIRREFRGLENRLPTIHLSGEDEVEIEKISREIDLVIQNRVEDIGRKKSLEPIERTFLQEQLTLVSNRTYLWVSLTLDVIENTSGFTKGNVRRAIRQIPQTVDDAYSRILDRSSDTEKARRLLHIVTAATRPLSLDEMSLTLAIEESHRSYDDVMQELEPEERFRVTLRELCGLFVVIIDAKIYLLHQTAKEFLVGNDSLVSLKDPSRLNSQCSSFKWKHSLKPGESNRILAERCIWYLNLDFVETRLSVLLNYSSHNWAAHFREAGIWSEETIAALARSLCETGSKRYKTWSAIYASNTYWFPRSAGPLTVASYFGLEVVVKLLLETGKVDVDWKDNYYDQTPLSWAAGNGHEAVVKLLLETGKVDVDSKDTNGQTPLSWAAGNGHEAVVKLLLETGKVDVDSKDNNVQTPLSWAARNGHEAVVKLLLETGKVD